MPAAIIFTQGGVSSPAGKARFVMQGVPVICTNEGAASMYVWTLLDAPLRSQLLRGQTSESASYTFTPDVPGTYLISLKINNSNFASENTTSFCAVKTSGDGAMGWRYRAAGEANEDNITTRDLNGNSLGFPNNQNPRGWATQDDLEREQIEQSVWDVFHATTQATSQGTTQLVKTHPGTGRLDVSLIPRHVHVQTAPASVWAITHNLGRYPAIVVVDTAGEEVEGEVQHTSTNTATLIFSAAFSGSATCG